MLQRLTGRRFLLFLGAMLFAFNGVLHPLFHTAAAQRGKTAETAAYDFRDDRHAQLHPAPHCPVCTGIFSAAEPAADAAMLFHEPPAAPAASFPAAVPACAQARAPPRIS